MLQIFFLECFFFSFGPHVDVFPVVVDDEGVGDQPVGVGERSLPLHLWQKEGRDDGVRVHLLVLHLLLLQALYHILEVRVGLDDTPGAQPRVALLVLPLLPQLGEHLLVHLPTLGLPLLPLSGVLDPVRLLVPAARELAVGHQQTLVLLFPLSLGLLEVLHQLLLEHRVAAREQDRNNPVPCEFSSYLFLL